MKDLVNRLDVIASRLQNAGLVKLAYEIDVVSDNLEKVASAKPLSEDVHRLATTLVALGASDPRMHEASEWVYHFTRETEPEESVLVEKMGPVSTPNKHSLITYLNHAKALLKGEPLEGDIKFVGTLGNILNSVT
jgi:hypothetical protein